MVKTLFRRFFPVCAAFFLAALGLLLFAGCTDVLQMSIFPSYLPALDKFIDLRDHLPAGEDYHGRIWPLWTQGGKRFLVLSIKQMFSGGDPGFYLLFDDELGYLRRVDSDSVYGSGQAYDIAPFAAPAPEENELLLGFDGPNEGLVFIDPLTGDFETKKDNKNLINDYRDTTNTGVAIPAEESVWFFHTEENQITPIEYIKTENDNPFGETKLFTIFGGESTEGGGVFLGAAPNTDRTGVVAYVRGNSSGKIYAFSIEDSTGTSTPLISSDDTNFPALRDELLYQVYPTRSGLVVVSWDEDLRLYKTDGKVLRKSTADIKDEVLWGFSSEGDFYYLLNKKRAQLFKMRVWW